MVIISKLSSGQEGTNTEQPLSGEGGVFFSSVPGHTTLTSSFPDS
jgi:hypothetical protein